MKNTKKKKIIRILLSWQNVTIVILVVTMQIHNTSVQEIACFLPVCNIFRQFLDADVDLVAKVDDSLENILFHLKQSWDEGFDFSDSRYHTCISEHIRVYYHLFSIMSISTLFWSMIPASIGDDLEIWFKELLR